jgi:general stress protein 26
MVTGRPGRRRGSDDWNARVKEALERTNIMALSTIGADGSWTSPVEYSYSSTLELTFVSMMDTKHVANILSDPRVSVAIDKPTRLPGGGSLGLQIKGTATRDPRRDDDDEGWHRFTIVPDEVWCFDSRVSRKRKRIDRAKLKL